MFEFLSDLPTLDILKYHISTGKDANLRQLLTIEKKTTFLTLRGGGGLAWIVNTIFDRSRR